MTKPAAIPPAIILVRPQMGENIGMAARAMANFALDDLRLVAPRDGWAEGSAVWQAAVDAAVGAHGIVRAAPVFADVAAAAADLNRLYATTARERDQAKPVLSAADLAAEAQA
ncbi:MAG: TrmH family RNA methyltransferase, partial [Beijerinckiaceae bacterium]